MQMARPATSAAAAVPACRPTGAARGLANLQRVDQGIEALREELVDLCHHATELGAVEMPLHHVHDILHQQVTLHLHSEVELTVELNVARSAEEAERQAKGESLTSADAIYGVDEDALKPEDFFNPEAEYDADEE